VTIKVIKGHYDIGRLPFERPHNYDFRLVFHVTVQLDLCLCLLPFSLHYQLFTKIKKWKLVVHSCDRTAYRIWVHSCQR